MKELVAERLRKIENLEQRQLLKDILNGVFINLVHYQEEQQRQLEERVFNEIENSEDKYEIYVTLCAKEDVDPIHDCLYPIVSSDVEDKTIDMEMIRSSIETNQQVKIHSLFLQCDSAEISKLLSQPRLFSGQLFTTTNQYEITVQLQRNLTYIQEIEKLYHIFHINGVQWRTVNNPYAFKFFDVILISCPQLQEDIVEITIDLEELDDKKMVNVIPLWNVERLEMTNVGFPTPAIDKVNYEHMISIQKTGNEHGYLIDSGEETIRYVKQSANELTVVSPKEKSGIWDVLKCTKVDREKVGKMQYELVSNRRMTHFMNKFTNSLTTSVKTKGELIRIINSFEAAQTIELVNVEISGVAKKKSISYSTNPFLIDHIDRESNKRVMELTFKKNGEVNYLSNDVLSFLVSEVQRYFPEYYCQGGWI